MKRLVPLLTLLLFCLAALSFIYRNTLLEQVLCQTLARAGGVEVACKINHSSIHGLEIGFLAASLPTTGLSFRAKTIHLSWNRDLLGRRQLERVTIDQLNLTVHPGPGQKKKAPSRPLEHLNRLGRLLERRLQLPVKELRVNCLELHAPAMPMLDSHCLRLFLRGRDRTAHLGIEDRSSRVRADIDFTPGSWSWRLGADGGGEDITWFKGKLTREEKGLRYTTDLALAHLQELAPLIPIPALPMAGTLNLSGLVTNGPEPTLHLQATLTQGRFRDTVVQEVNLLIKARFSADRCLLGPASRLQVKDLKNRAVPFSVAGLEVPLAAEFTQNGRAWTTTWPAGQALHLAGAAGKGVSLDRGELVMPRRITAVGKQIRIQGSGQDAFMFTGLRIADSSVNQLTVTAEQPYSMVMHTDAAGLSWLMEPNTWKLTVSGLQITQARVVPEPFFIRLDTLRKSRDNIRLKGAITTSALHIAAGKIGLTLRSPHLDVVADQGQVHVRGRLRLNGLPEELGLTIGHDLESGRGKLRMTTKPTLTFSKKHPLSKILDRWVLPADLESGTLSALAEAAWPDRSLKIRLNIDNGAGRFKGTAFTGLDTDLHLALLPRIKTLAPARINLAAVHGPVEMHNLATTLIIKPGNGPLPRITLQKNRVELLGGSLKNRELTLDLNHPELVTTVMVERLNLEGLLALQQVKGLTVNGIVSGILPIRYDKNGLSVEGGELKNIPPGGVIRYRPEQGTVPQSSPLTEIALKALEEFHYRLLSARADYQPDGTLKVSMHLEGKSPKLDSTRPVHLNINTEQNIISLLESLRYSEALTNEIDKRIQHHFQPDQSQ